MKILLIALVIAITTGCAAVPKSDPDTISVPPDKKVTITIVIE